MKKLILIAIVLLLSTSISLAQDFCKADLDYDGDCDGEDLSGLLAEFGRGFYSNPCPPDGPSPVPQSGQTTSYATGDDGDLERGVALVTLRFIDNGDGTVTDNLTGLIWLKDANCFGPRTWNLALSESNGMQSGICGLTDGSSEGDWRLPQIKELQSLIDYENYGPVLPTGHPFTNVSSSYYWSSSTGTYDTSYAWLVYMFNGVVGNVGKSNLYYVWPVRGGH